MPPKQKPRSASVVVDSDDDATSLGGLSGPPTPFASRERSRKSLQAPSRKRKRKPTSGDESGLDLVGISLEEMEEAKGFLSSGKPSSKKQKMQTKGGKVSAGSKAKKSRKASKADTNDGTDTDAPEGTIYEPGDGTADIADLYNSRLPKLEEEREKKRKKLANGNQLRAIDSIHGCYIVNLRMTLEANRPVAGYLNLYNTVQLQTVLEICLPELERMAAFEQVNYGCEAGVQFKVETFLGDLQAGKVPYDDISSTSVPDTSRYPPKNKSDQGRYHLYIARFAHRIRPILDAAHVQGELPKILTGPHEQDASRVLFDSTPNRWEVEDLMRCVFIWHTFKRKNRPALKKLRGEYLDAEKQEAAKAESSKSKPAAHDPMFDQVMADAAKDDRVMHAAREHHLAAQAIIKKNKEQKPSTDDAAVKVKRRRGQNEARTWDLHFYKDMPELPIWFNPQASIVMSAEDEAAIRESLENLHSRQRVTELMQQWYEQTDLDVDPEEMARHTNDLVGAADFAKVVQGVAKLSDPVAQGLLTALGDGVEVLFDNNRKIDRFAAHGKATASFRSAAQAEADDMEALADGNPDWHKLTQAEKDALHERYLQHNVFLNRKSACPPPFREACRAIGVTVTDLPAGETDPITGASIRLELEGLRLKVWQPQAIAYMAFALTSPMRACILADGVGVGKTVMALATAAHMQKAQVAKQEAWEAAVQERVEHYRATEPEALGLATREEIIAARSVHDDVQAASIQRPVFRPFLVIVPPNAGETWTSQADKFFKAAETAHDLDVRTLGTLGAATSVASVVQRSIGTSAAKLSTWITEMHERRYDPATGRIGLIATLQGWQRAALSKNAKFRLKLDPGELARRRQQAAQARRRCGEDLEGDVDVDEDNADLGDDIYTDEEFEKIKEGLMLRIPMDAFDLCIIDEAHRVGNVGRLQAEAAYLLDAKFLLLTATPMKTNAKDFKGLLRFMFKGSAEQVRKSSFKPAPASYRKYAHILETQREGRLDRIRPNELIDYLAHLNPDSYASCLADASGKDALGGADLIPLIFMLCVLKRVKGSPVDLGKPPPAADDDATMSDGTPPDASNDTGGTIYRLGEEIPRCETVTVELAQLPLEKMFHRGVLDALANKEANPGPGKSDGAGTAGKKSSAAQFTRRTALALSAYNPRLFQFTQRYTHNRAGSVNKFVTDSKDAFDFFYTWTCRDPGVPAPTTVAEMAYYLCDTSAKTSYLARLLADIVYKRREKLIIWAHEPLTLFVTELFLWIVGIEPMAIRPGVKSSQRIRAMQDFNNNPRRRVLLLADRTAQESMNLQAACHNMVAMDAVDNGSKSQMTGRIHRVGQQHVCRAFFLNTDETIDQRIEAQYWLRARTITASQLELDDDLLKDLEARLSEADIIQMTKEVNASPQSISKRHYLTKRFREAVVDAAQREEWGVRSTRDGAWLNETDFEAKNLEPQERLFRMAYGGRVADRLAYQVRCTRREPEAEKKQEKYEALDPQEAHRYVAVKVPENCWAVEPPLFHAKDVPVVTQAEAVVLIVQAGCAAARKLFKYGATPYVMLDGARRQVARPSRHISAAIAIVKQMGLAEVTDISDLDWEDCEIEEELKQYNRDPVLYRQQFEAKEGGADAMTVDDPRDSHQSDLTEHDSPTRRDLDGNGTGEDDSEGEEEGGSGTEDEESADEDASDVAASARAASSAWAAVRGSTVANIKAFATRNNVKLGSAKTKGDMQARVDEVMGARAAALESDGDDRSQS